MTIERIAERAARMLHPDGSADDAERLETTRKNVKDCLLQELAPLAKCVEACDVIVNKAPNVSDAHKWRWAYLVAHDALSALKKEEGIKLSFKTSSPGPDVRFYNVKPRRNP